MHHLQRHHRWPLLAMVAALAGVTATSVALAIAALIDNTLLAALFASAAVGLDLFKYIAWPLALGLLVVRRTLCALLMMACALALGTVSGWATYDRLMSSIINSRAEHQARQEQRQIDLVEQRDADAARIGQLDSDAAAVHQQAEGQRPGDILEQVQDHCGRGEQDGEQGVVDQRDDGQSHRRGGYPRQCGGHGQ